MRDRNKLSERQRNILRFIESHLETHGFPPTIRQIGKATGIESTSVVNYNLNKLVSAGYLAREARASRGLRLTKDRNGSGRRQAAQNNTMQVRYAGPIAAGQPIQIPTDLQDTGELVDVLPGMLHGVDPNEVYALRVKGDSMIDAMISDGDIVLIRRQQTADDGEMCAVFMDDRNETTLKYFFRQGDQVRLQPAHPTMQPIMVDAKNCHVQGRVLSVMRMSV